MVRRFLFTLILFSSLCAAAQETLEQRVRAIVRPHLEKLVHHKEARASGLQAPGGIIAVYIEGKQFYFAAGRIDDKGTAPTRDTIFGLGSVTKTFTTSIFGQQPDLFTQAVTAGPLPKGFQLEPAERPVTFEQLATFTAGIPTAPDFCSSVTPPVCSQSDFVRFINGVTPPDSKLPAPNVYSDSSIGFLAQILMVRDGFQDVGPEETQAWFDRNLFSPLGMKNTGFPARPDPAHPLSRPFNYCTDSGYSTTTYAPWVPWGAAGRTFSTAADMLGFVQAYLGVRVIDGKEVPEKIRAGMRRALEPRASMSAQSASRQAFAWVTWPEELPTKSRISGKAGGITGVSSYVAVNPDLGYGVVTLTNLHFVPVEPATIAIMEELQSLILK